MPQLEFWHYLPQFFWLAVCFIGLYLVMAFVALPRIERVLTRRAETIAGHLAAAEEARVEADAARAAFDTTLARARDDARASIAEAAAAAASAGEAKARALDRDIAGRIEGAEREIAAAKAVAMRDLGAIAAAAARQAAGRLTGVEIGEAQAKAAVDAARDG